MPRLNCRFETCVTVRGTARHPMGLKPPTSTVRQSRTANNSEVQIIVGVGPSCRTFAGATHRKGANIEDLEIRPKVLQTQYGNILV